MRILLVAAAVTMGTLLVLAPGAQALGWVWLEVQQDRVAAVVCAPTGTSGSAVGDDGSEVCVGVDCKGNPTATLDGRDCDCDGFARPT